MAAVTHCNLKAARRRTGRSGLIFGQICTAHAQKLEFSSFRSKYWHRP